MSRIERALKLALWGLGALVATSAVEARADEAPTDAHHARFDQAQQLMRSEQFIEALKELEAAYALSQVPQLLYYQGLAHQSLGHSKEALTFYEMFLSRGGPRDPAERSALLRRISALKQIDALTPPPPSLAPPPSLFQGVPFRIETRPHHHGMLVAGSVMLGIGYVFAFGTGIAYTTFGGSTQAAGGTLLLPVVGPLISSAILYDNILSWGLPWLLTDLPLQISGLALIIQGYRTKQRVLVPNLPGGAELTLLRPYASPDGAGMIAIGRF